MGEKRTVSTWGGRMVVVSQPAKKRPLKSTKPSTKIRNGVVGKQAAAKDNITAPANNAQTNAPTANVLSVRWSRWCSERLAVANTHNPQDG
jgi:hypothetical protein